MAKKTLTVVIGDTRHDIDLELPDNGGHVESEALPDENIWLEVDGRTMGSIFVTRQDDDVHLQLGRFDEDEGWWREDNPLREGTAID